MKIAFVLEGFTLGSPGQQLLDRFLIGWPREGKFQRLSGVTGVEIALWIAGVPEDRPAEIMRSDDLTARERDFKLLRPRSLTRTLENAGAVLVAPGGDRIAVSEELLKMVFKQAAGSACFVYGTLSTSAVAMLAQSVQSGLAGGSVGTALHLPGLEIPRNSKVGEALIVVQGPHPLAEWNGIDGLLPLIARQQDVSRPPIDAKDKTDAFPIKAVRRLRGAEVWRAGDSGEWSWALLSAALSRSNTPLGDPELDGRTQDLAGLGLVPKLAKDPRGWIIEHAGGLRSTILVLNGVVRDINAAIRTGKRTVLSTQLYRPPAPARGEFDQLAAVIEDFFISGDAPWPLQRSFAAAQFMEVVTRDSP